MNEFDLTGKVAVVTGAGQGIGEGIAKSMAGAGAAVIVASRSKDKIERVAEEIQSAGGKALAVLRMSLTEVHWLILPRLP